MSIYIAEYLMKIEKFSGQQDKRRMPEQEKFVGLCRESTKMINSHLLIRALRIAI